MAGQISRPNNREFDIRDDETFSDWKRRKAEENGTVQGIGQKNKKDTSNWSEAQKRGKRSRDKGMRKQREARKQLKIPNSKFRSNMGNEENWRGELRFEVKAGKQRNMNPGNVLAYMAERIIELFPPTAPEHSMINIVIHKKESGKGNKRKNTDEIVHMTFEDFSKMMTMIDFYHKIY